LIDGMMIDLIIMILGVDFIERTFSKMKDSINGPVLLYDGVCGLCNKSVQLILKNDKQGIFRFAALQSELGKKVESMHPELKSVDSVILLEPASDGDPIISIRSTAVLRVLKYLGGKWRIFLLAYLVPRPIRDFLYDLVAKWRYKLFGKYDSCLLPSAEVRNRFIAD
jgi:predicted DCC family thiol-disulfide oxidoreductase YuxK